MTLCEKASTVSLFSPGVLPLGQAVTIMFKCALSLSDMPGPWSPHFHHSVFGNILSSAINPTENPAMVKGLNKIEPLLPLG